MELLVRPALPEDACVPLLFESAKPYYTAYAGSERRALKLLQRVFPRPGHAASYECTQLATTHEDEIVGVLAAFPVRDGDRLSRRFIRLTLPRVPPWGLLSTFGHLYAAGGVAPRPPLDAYYVDALAVSAAHRRRGIAPAPARTGRTRRRAGGLGRIALDTGLQNAPARALYDAYGSGEREIRRAPSDRMAKELAAPALWAT